jgi:hypothetical protein
LEQGLSFFVTEYMIKKKNLDWIVWWITTLQNWEC